MSTTTGGGRLAGRIGPVTGAAMSTAKPWAVALPT